jgi:hypothetical protein
MEPQEPPVSCSKPLGAHPKGNARTAPGTRRPINPRSFPLAYQLSDALEVPKGRTAARAVRAFKKTLRTRALGLY